MPPGTRFFLVIHAGKMQNNSQDKSRLLSSQYPECRKLVPDAIWEQLAAAAESAEGFADILRDRASALELEPYLGELARMESYVSSLKTDNIPVPEYSEKHPSFSFAENR